MRLSYWILSAVIIGTVISCTSNTHKNNDSVGKYDLKYARGFSVEIHEEYKLIKVRDPWDTIRTLYQYVLIDRDKPVPSGLPEGTLVKVPLQTVVAFSTIQCSMLQEIGEHGRITGVCQAQYIDIPYIRKQLTSGKIIDLGSMHKPDIEKLIDLTPAALVVSAMETGLGYLDKLNIPVIATTDYMEDTALGRAEWIRFHALFYQKEDYADSLFSETERHYNAIKDMVKDVPQKPSVFNDLKYGKTWRIAGGKSYLANMIRDAGGDYIWSDDPTTGYIRLSAEVILDKAESADIWLLKYNRSEDFTYNRLKGEDRIYSQFEAFRKKHIWECNTDRIHYFEDLPIHPDWILKDMAAIFHPYLFPDTQLNYFKQLTE